MILNDHLNTIDNPTQSIRIIFEEHQRFQDQLNSSLQENDNLKNKNFDLKFIQTNSTRKTST
jgi:hypothetical protein